MIEITDEFAAALHRLHTGENLLLTGRAGTGKTTLIQHFLASTTKRVVLAAPTGVAALNLGGYTLHRLFSFPTTITPEAVRTGKVTAGRYAKLLSQLDTLVIDEISMVRADLFDAVVAALEAYGPKPGAPFGGVQLVLVGDLYQLPPVVQRREAEYFSSHYSTPYFFSAKSYRSSAFSCLHLRRVFRQQNDAKLAAMLDALRAGRITETIATQLNAQVDADFTPPPEEVWVTLATTNRAAKRRNDAELARLASDLHEFHAQISGELDGFRPPTDAQLKLKIGAQVMLVNNDAAGRWVNGSLAVVLAIEAEDETKPAVLLELLDGTVVRVKAHEWKITRPRIGEQGLVHETIGTFTQLPIKLAWAITIHKAQGLTLPRVIVDLRGGVHFPGQLYVALSRCTSLAGLVLTRAVKPRDVRVDSRVREFVATDAFGGDAQQYCALEALFVGEGDKHPRAIELALALPEGTIVESVINPQRDLDLAPVRYGIDAQLAQIAPTLAQAWPAFAAEMEHLGIASLLGRRLVDLLNNELTRLGTFAPLEEIGQLRGPITPIDAPVSALNPSGARSATDAAAHTLSLLSDHGIVVPAAAFELFEEIKPGFLCTRTGEIIPFGSPQEVTTMLAANLAGAQVSEESEVALRAFERRYHVTVPRPTPQSAPPIRHVLQPGTRVCFTGTLVDHEREWQRGELVDLAADCGLKPVRKVTKTRCDVLFCADLASQSGKMRQARSWQIPIYPISEFVHWATHRAGSSVHFLPRPPESGAGPSADENPHLIGQVERTLHDDRVPQSADILAPDQSPIHLVPQVIDAPYAGRPGITDVLVAGARICFTGRAVFHRRIWPLAELRDIARIYDLAPLRQVVKVGCDALVTADPLANTHACQLARQYDIPIFSTAEFLIWAGWSSEEPT
ncbi:MAG: AAA family ATPase [Bowdeniella nasicola]|nr:AAA family ATPase [Bowdeniella nasicola]